MEIEELMEKSRTDECKYFYNVILGSLAVRVFSKPADAITSAFQYLQINNFFGMKFEGPPLFATAEIDEYDATIVATNPSTDPSLTSLMAVHESQPEIAFENPFRICQNQIEINWVV